MNPYITYKFVLLKYLTVVKKRCGLGIFSGVTPCIYVNVTSSSGKQKLLLASAESYHEIEGSIFV